MKKKIIGKMVVIFITGLVFLGGCGKPNQNQASYIGIEEAKRIALEDAGIPAEDAVFIEASLDVHDDVEHYDIDFVFGTMKMEYDIDAMTGEIIDLSKREATPEDLEKAANAGESGHLSEKGETGSTDGQIGSQTALRGDIGSDKAQEIALTDAGLSQADVTSIWISPDYEDGRKIYEVEFYTADYKEYDYEIDAASGTVLSKDYDAEYYGSQGAGTQGSQSSGGEIISEAKAKQIALEKVPGANGVMKMKLERDDRKAKYEGKIVYNGMEYEFEIDAYSGTVLEWEAESIYD